MHMHMYMHTHTHIHTKQAASAMCSYNKVNGTHSCGECHVRAPPGSSPSVTKSEALANLG
jgi:hypothetical protein